MSSHNCYYKEHDRCDSKECYCECHNKRIVVEKPKETRGRKRKIL